jgi:hypothetical protein
MADRAFRFNNWFQIISNVAIIFGLGLVVYELNQSKQLANAQFVTENFHRMTSIQIAMMGEDPREALAKAALHPADLNEREVVTLDAYYESIMMGWFSLRVSSEYGDFDAPWRLTVVNSVQKDFSTEPGRRWLRAWAAEADDTFGMKEVAEVAEGALQDDSGNVFRSRYELLLANE